MENVNLCICKYNRQLILKMTIDEATLKMTIT